MTGHHHTCHYFSLPACLPHTHTQTQTHPHFGHTLSLMILVLLMETHIMQNCSVSMCLFLPSDWIVLCTVIICNSNSSMLVWFIRKQLPGTGSLQSQATCSTYQNHSGSRHWCWWWCLAMQRWFSPQSVTSPDIPKHEVASHQNQKFLSWLICGKDRRQWGDC